MQASSRFVVTVAAVLVSGLFVDPAWAQNAVARLDTVASGRIDNPSETDWEEREMCLDAGMYVFAFARGSSNANGLAIVGFGVHLVGGQPHFEEVPDQEIGEIITISDSHQRGWGWLTFSVSEDNTCLPLAAVHGRARVYQIAVGIDW